MDAADALIVRPATPADAAHLAELRVASRAGSAHVGADEALVAHEVDFLDRLAIPHGEDYFCLVAERDGRIVGYVIGGGSRDLDRKAHGEVYELCAHPDEPSEGAAGHLLGAAITAFAHAAFAGTLLTLDASDTALRAVATSAGMHESPVGAGRLRYECRPETER